ncbi:MAG: ribulose-bisphosphate carboxylase [Leptonema sp. (in: bacteria)]
MLNQSNRYVNLDLREEDLIKAGKHVLCAYRMKPKAGYDFVETAAHFAAESSTGTNVEVYTTDDFTRSVDALVYEVDESKELIKIAYPMDLFDRNISDGRINITNLLTLVVGNNQGMSDVEYAKLLDIYFPKSFLDLTYGPITNIESLWRVLGRPSKDGGLVVGTIIKPKLGLNPEKFAQACYDFWLGGDFIKNDEPQANQPFASYEKTMRLVSDTMKRVQDETGQPKLFSANISADDPFEVIKRGELVLEIFAENSNHVAFLIDGFIMGTTGVTLVRKYFPDQFIHYHRAGHASITSEQSLRGYTSYVHMKIARIQGASGIHTGTMGFGKMEGKPTDKILAQVLTEEEIQGPYYYQKWFGMKSTTPIISGGMNAIRLYRFLENLGHANIIQTSGGGSFGHLDGAAAGAKASRQAYEAWKNGIDLLEYAKEHKELRRTFESFSHDADKFYPNWREVLKI